MKKFPPWFDDWRADAVQKRYKRDSLLDAYPKCIELLHELMIRAANGEGTVPIRAQWKMCRERFGIKLALGTFQHDIERRWPELYEKAHSRNKNSGRRVDSEVREGDGHKARKSKTRA